MHFKQYSDICIFYALRSNFIELSKNTVTITVKIYGRFLFF